ncbi:MAG: hypothetical protein SOV61_00375 [Lachnospiraceae bacterium]|nr:hypothetical protein [Lachnospiraceae bacterium]MDY2697998.1 hypothetical protein [Lachnospiraceae bacterium]MDY5520672.1 hypothetical protein [Agathobacter sp.]
MSEFDENRALYKNAKRGTYIIFPLKYRGQFDFSTWIVLDSTEEDFRSDDLSAILIQKCSRENGFVKRFVFEHPMNGVTYDDGQVIPIEEMQLFVFNNEIAFLTVLLVYDNAQTRYIYELINPGYLDDKKDDLQRDIDAFVKNINVNGQKSVFELYVGQIKFAIKESYAFNVAIVNKRFNQLETIEKASYNAHRLIDLSSDFADVSEADIAYTYGAKDVEKCTYRWGACISSQSISYVYAVEGKEITEKDIIDVSADDLLLTMLVLFQKNTCMLLNDKIQNTLRERDNRHFSKNIMNLKREALEFRAAGTLAPSQVSRWNNVCETYRHLLIVNGVDEALEEIEQKIELMKDEQERAASQIQNYISTVIAVFGLISIIDSVLCIVDVVDGGSSKVLMALGVSCLGVVIFVVSWIIMILKRR